ncbi:MAG: hypothetical protein IKR84_04815, partial [Oscillibacter sp.]|nr:hypothetical protein [Oscillibacter sp.]
MTGLDVPEGAPVEASMPVPGRDAQADSETVSQPRDSLPPLPALESGSSVITPETRPTVQVSNARVSRRTGETETVTVTVGGYPSGAYLQASNSNSAAFSCIWGDWNAFTIPLRITGRASGGGEIRLSLKDTNNQELTYTTIQVTIVEETPTLTVSPADLSVNVGESARATLTVNHYSGGGTLSASVADGSVCATRWGNWDGAAVPITVTGRASGTTRVTIRLYNSARTELASVTLNVEVNPSATLTASPASVSVCAGESAVVTVSSDSALANGDSFQYSTSNSARFSVSADGTSGDSIRLVVTGESAGSGTLTVTLNSQSGARVSIPVTVTARPENERVIVASSSVTLDVGQTTKVTCTALNVSGQCTMRCINNDPSVLDCGWRDDWAGRSLPVTITGKATGTGTVTIGLVVGGVVRSTATIQVTVCEPDPVIDPAPVRPEPTPGPVAASPSYSFENYSKPGISLALCQYMFGDNQRARTVHYYDVGNGGVCFGIATTAGLLSGTDAPGPDAFGKASMSALRKSDYSTTLDPNFGLSLTDFIEAMHISQAAYATMRELSGVRNLVDEVRRGGNSRPAIVCLRGREGGHAILAYGVTENGSLRVYDSNYPSQERTVNVSGENWSYDIAPHIRWNQSNGQISYIPYDTYYNAWNNHRGSLNAALLDGHSPRYLLATTADNFTLTVFDADYEAPDGEEPYQRQVAVYADGVLQPGHDETIAEVFVSNVPLNAEAPNHLHMLYVPGEELYTVRNENFVDGSRLMDVALSGDGLSVHVNSEAEKFVLAVSDAERFATAMLNGLQEGEYYSVSVGSSLDGDSGNPVNNANIEGYGNG